MQPIRVQKSRPTTTLYSYKLVKTYEGKVVDTFQTTSTGHLFFRALWELLKLW